MEERLVMLRNLRYDMLRDDHLVLMCLWICLLEYGSPVSSTGGLCLDSFWQHAQEFGCNKRVEGFENKGCSSQ